MAAVLMCARVDLTLTPGGEEEIKGDMGLSVHFRRNTQCLNVNEP